MTHSLFALTPIFSFEAHILIHDLFSQFTLPQLWTSLSSHVCPKHSRYHQLRYNGHPYADLPQ